MQKKLKILARAVEQWEARESVVGYTGTAAELTQTVDVSLGDSACSETELEHSIQDYLKFSPKVSHPEFYKLLYSGENKDALLGDWIASLTNCTMHTYQVSPVSTLMELELIHQWNKLIGFAQGDGVMVAGGSQANIVGMMLARHKACPELKSLGHRACSKNLIAYVSDQAHYSNQRAVNVLGIGADNLRSVASDEHGRMDPAALTSLLEKDLKAGNQPFYIGLTAGTTVVGAFDPVKAFSDIALEHDLWLHIDGAWGAPVLFSKKHRQLLADSHLADSFAWDAHKLMNVPITAAAILVKRAGMLKEVTGAGGADYLFHSDANSDYNLGQRSLQCGRRADALKVWLSWKAVGNQGFENKVDQLQALKNQCVKMIKTSACFEMLAPADYLNILFRFSHQSISEDELDQLNVQICKTMLANGGPYVDHAQYKGKRGIRLILANELTTEDHLERLLGDAERIGNQLLCNPSSLSL